MFEIIAQKIKLGNSSPPDSSRQPETLRRWRIRHDAQDQIECKAAVPCYGAPKSSYMVMKCLEKQALLSFYASSLNIKEYYI